MRDPLSYFQPTEVFRTYWYFASERLRMYNRRLEKSNLPSTEDPILSEYRFTNTFRSIDRVSQYLISTVQRGEGVCKSPANIIFRTLLFKFYNKIETWEILESRLGNIDVDTFDYKLAASILDEEMLHGKAVYSGAYIMPAPRFGHKRKHRNHLEFLRSITTQQGIAHLLGSKDLSELYYKLLELPGLGRFLAFQFAIDINYSEIFKFDEGSFVVAGPGAHDGLSKCFQNFTATDAERIILDVCKNQLLYFDKYDVEPASLFGRKLQPIDCQNLFCEISKYSRVSHPEFTGVSGRTRIKQKYRKHKLPISRPVFPDHWELGNNV